MQYAISDIHGQRKLFYELVKSIGFRSGRDHLYLLGDAIDRGGEDGGVSLLLDILKMHKSGNATLLLGNHEFFVLQKYVKNPSALPWNRFVSSEDSWLSNGGAKTIRALERLASTQRDSLIKFLCSCPIQQEVTVGERSFVLAHAAPISGYRSGQGFASSFEYAAWARPEERDLSGLNQDQIFIHGHTPTCFEGDEPAGGPLSIFHSPDGKRINIDCGAAAMGCEGLPFVPRLGALCLDSEEEFYVQ